MDSHIVRLSMSQRRSNEGPYGIHDTMLDVVELAILRLERFQKRHKLEVPDRKLNWTWETDRQIPRCSPNDPLPVVAATFLDALPGDVVEDALWPWLMKGQTPHENFKTLCLLRCVCTAWLIYAEESREWPLAFQAWIRGDHRFIVDANENPYLDTDSESDPSWGYAGSDGECSVGNAAQDEEE